MCTSLTTHTKGVNLLNNPSSRGCKASITCPNSTPLNPEPEPLNSKCPEVARFLLQRGADVNLPGAKEGLSRMRFPEHLPPPNETREKTNPNAN